MPDIADELPDHAPRFVLLSYPLTLVRLLHTTPPHSIQPTHTPTDITQHQDSGRLAVPYVMLYYLPVTCNNEVKMLYAGAKELMRNTAEVNKIIEIDSAEEIEEIEGLLKGDA
jgi:hypothetical protein